MNIFDVMSEEELEALPDDPEAAMIVFARRAQGVYNENYDRLSSFQDGWDHIRKEQRGFMNVVVAVAKRLGITALKDFDINVSRQEQDDHFEEFQTALDHYLAQIVVGQALQRKKAGVELSPKVKDRIRGHINALKKLLDGADVTPRRKAHMMTRLEEFEKELDKHRVQWAMVGLFTLEILALPSDLVGSYDIANKLVTNIVHELQTAKLEEEERRPLPGPNFDGYLPSPPKPPEVQKPKRRPSSAPAFEGSMDDDIPF